MISFGDYGPNAQVVDFDGRRAIQFITGGGVQRVNFGLYRLSLAQFLDRYSSGFKGVAGFERIPISLEGAARQVQWQVDTREKGAGYQGNVYETIIPAEVPAGLYVLDMQAGQSSAQLMVVLTRNTLVVKQVEGQLVAWVTDINGEGLAGARVSVYARDGVLVEQGHSDRDGVFRTHVGGDPQPLIVVAEDSRDLTGHEIEGTDITASGLSNEWQNSYNPWWGWWQTAPTSTKYAVYLQTDRPIYRPGQTVYFKAIARQDEDAQINPLPEGTPLTLRVRDARDNVVQTFELATNTFGSANGEFQLAEGAMLGDYNLEAVLEGESQRQVFKVQDYRKPDYQVAITTDAAHYVLGDAIQVEVDASYFFGQPVANATLSIQRYELQPYYSYWWEDSSKDQPEYTWYHSGEVTTSGHTDENGHYALTGRQAQMGSGYNPQDYGYAGSLQEDAFVIEVLQQVISDLRKLGSCWADVIPYVRWDIRQQQNLLQAARAFLPGHVALCLDACDLTSDLGTQAEELLVRQQMLRALLAQTVPHLYGAGAEATPVREALTVSAPGAAAHHDAEIRSGRLERGDAGHQGSAGVASRPRSTISHRNPSAQSGTVSSMSNDDTSRWRTS